MLLYFESDEDTKVEPVYDENGSITGVTNSVEEVVKENVVQGFNSWMHESHNFSNYLFIYVIIKCIGKKKWQIFTDFLQHKAEHQRSFAGSFLWSLREGSK